MLASKMLVIRNANQKSLTSENYVVTKHMLSFRERVFAVVKKIPRGKTLSYAAVARQAGSPRAYRAVGSILKKNFDSTIPCHRVIKSDGTLGEYNCGVSEKIRKLRAEGVTF